MNYKVYTDGAYSKMNNEGAFAFVILNDCGQVVLRRAYKITDETNNRAELKAIIAAIHKLPADATDVEIISDSQYALNTLRGSWARKKNHDLFKVWNEVLLKRFDLSIIYKWVRGHNGNHYNEMCDKMCNDILGYDANAEFAEYKKH